MLCQACYGSGQIMGNGYQMQDCPKCVYFPAEHSICNSVIEKPIIDKRSKSYRNAIRDLQALHPEKSQDEICKLFEETFNALDA